MAEVLILQHPLEASQSKGSGRLLHRSLPNSRLEIGEIFEQETLRRLLHRPWGATTENPDGMPAAPQPALLYPDPPNTLDTPGAPLPGDGSRLRLIVLDATWRKSRKMLYLNPQLSALPRLALQTPPPSRYRIRKAHGAHQLSTLEATCHALMRLEPDSAGLQTLLAAFDGFVAQQDSYLLKLPRPPQP